MTPKAREDLIAVVQLPAATAAQPAAASAAPDDPALVAPGRRVTLHFSLTLEDGAVVDSCFERAPVSFTVGDGSLLPDFEQSLFGLRAGQTRETLLPPERAFGLPAPGNVQRFPRFRFPPDLQLTEGLVMDFADSNGYSQAGVVRRFDSQFVHIDFNHPLAGRSILFRASIVAVEPS